MYKGGSISLCKCKTIKSMTNLILSLLEKKYAMGMEQNEHPTGLYFIPIAQNKPCYCRSTNHMTLFDSVNSLKAYFILINQI